MHLWQNCVIIKVTMFGEGICGVKKKSQSFSDHNTEWSDLWHSQCKNYSEFWMWKFVFRENFIKGLSGSNQCLIYLTTGPYLRNGVYF